MRDVTPPAGLPPDQHPIWADTIARLQTLGLLDRADPNHLRAYVAAVHQHQQATYLLDNSGPVIIRKVGDREEAAPSPVLGVAEKAERRVAHLARTLLLTGRGAPAAGMGRAPVMERPRPPGEAGQWCEEHKRWECTKNKHGGTRCHKSRLRGTDACTMHGGRNAKARSLAVVAQHDFPLAVEPVDIHPAEALLWRVKYLTAFLRAIDAEVARIGREEATWGLERQEASELGERVVHGARLSPWLELQDRTNRALVAAASAALQANAEERLVRMAEAQGARLFAAYQRGLGKLGLSPAQWDLAVAGYAEVLGELVS
jgi:phage terminase small subunit